MVMDRQQAQLAATGGDKVRAYLSAQGMLDEDIAKYLGQARGEELASFTFGPDEAGIAPRYTLLFADEVYRLTVEHAA
jgi:hypothetical protein